MAQAAKPTNGFNPDKLKSYVSRVENIQTEIASETGAFMKTIQDHKTDIKKIYTEAKQEGIPVKPLKAFLKQRKLQRDLEKVEDDLESEDADSLAAIRDALGDWADEVSARAA